MTLREMLQQTPIEFLDTELDDLNQAVLLVEHKDGRVIPFNFCTSVDPSSPVDLCQFFIDNFDDYDMRKSVKVVEPEDGK